MPKADIFSVLNKIIKWHKEILHILKSFNKNLVWQAFSKWSNELTKKSLVDFAEKRMNENDEHRHQSN